jgi:hypothetical protein
MTTHTIHGERVNLADYTRQTLSDGTVTWVHRDLSHRIVMVRKRDIQRIKGMRRRAAGKPFVSAASGFGEGGGAEARGPRRRAGLALSLLAGLLDVGGPAAVLG